MAVYDGECQRCGMIQAYSCPIADRHDQDCGACGGKLRLIILHAPSGYITGKFDAFRSVVDGSLISSQRSMEEHNKRNNVVCLSDGYDDATIKAGNFGRKESVLDKKELASDIQEAIHMVEQGYKPEIGADDGN